jgi:hypothetical protein
MHEGTLMPQSKRPRKSYKPRRIDADPVGLAIGCVSLLTPRQRRSLMDPALLALDLMRQGRGTWDAWRALADVGNVAEALAEDGIARNLLEQIEDGQEALSRVHDAVASGGSWTLRGPEIAALDDLVWVHGVQLDHASQGEVASAIRRVRDRIAGARAGNVGRGVTVLQGGIGVDSGG